MAVKGGVFYNRSGSLFQRLRLRLQEPRLKGNSHEWITAWDPRLADSLHCIGCTLPIVTSKRGQT